MRKTRNRLTQSEESKSMIDLGILAVGLGFAKEIGCFKPLEAMMNRIEDDYKHGPYSPFYWHRRNHYDYWGDNPFVARRVKIARGLYILRWSRYHETL